MRRRGSDQSPLHRPGPSEGASRAVRLAVAVLVAAAPTSLLAQTAPAPAVGPAPYNALAPQPVPGSADEAAAARRPGAATTPAGARRAPARPAGSTALPETRPVSPPTLRETLLRSAVGTSGASNPLDDDLRLGRPTTPGTTGTTATARDGTTPSPTTAAELEDPTGDPTRSGDAISTIIRTDDRLRARRPRPNNQGETIVNNQASAPAAEVDAALRADRRVTRPQGRVEPVGALRPGEDTAARTPQAATQPTPRDMQAERRVEAEKEDEALAPLGIRSGGFTWLPAVESSLGRSSNVAGKANAVAGAVASVAPELVGKSDWSRHELQIDLRGSYVTTPADHSYDKPNVSGTLRGRVDLSEEMRVDLKGGWTYERQSNSSSDNPASTDVPSNLQSRTLSVGVTRDAGLLALTLRGDMERSDYSGGTSTTGASLGSEIQNNTRFIGAVRATYGSPGSLRPFVEVQGSTRRYDQDVVAGSQRDGQGAAVKVGAVADLGPTLRGEMSTGWATEKPKDTALGTMSGWLLDGTLTWSPNRITVVKVTAKTEFVPTTTAGSPGAQSRTTSVQLERALRPELVAAAGVQYTDKSYFGITQNEHDLVLSSALTYKWNRNFHTFVRGSWEKLGSNIPGADYSTTLVMVGVRVQQ